MYGSMARAISATVRPLQIFWGHSIGLTALYGTAWLFREREEKLLSYWAPLNIRTASLPTEMPRSNCGTATTIGCMTMHLMLSDTGEPLLQMIVANILFRPYCLCHTTLETESFGLHIFI